MVMKYFKLVYVRAFCNNYTINVDIEVQTHLTESVTITYILLLFLIHQCIII